MGGPTLLEEQKKICDKFYNFDTSNMDYLAKSIIPLCSDRQAVFEGEAANKLKKSHDSFDATLAAPKSFVTNSLFNLYPKYGYKKMLKTIEENIIKNNVNVFLGEFINSIERREAKYVLNSNNPNRDKTYDRVYCSIDERLSEKILLDSSKLIELTHYVPQHFVYIECDFGAIGELNYLFDYDLNHISNRFTDLKYSLKNTDKTVICAEVTATKNPLNINKEDTDKIVSKCCRASRNK